MVKLTKAQRRNLEHVREHGSPTPGSRAGFNCRVAGWSEFVWLLADGSTATNSEVVAMGKPLPEERCCVKVVREQLTPAGRAALADGGRDEQR